MGRENLTLGDVSIKDAVQMSALCRQISCSDACPLRGPFGSDYCKLSCIGRYISEFITQNDLDLDMTLADINKTLNFN